MIEYSQNRKDVQNERLIEDFFIWDESESASREITVDYFISEFLNVPEFL